MPKQQHACKILVSQQHTSGLLQLEFFQMSHDRKLLNTHKALHRMKYLWLVSEQAVYSLSVKACYVVVVRQKFESHGFPGRLELVCLGEGISFRYMLFIGSQLKILLDNRVGHSRNARQRKKSSRPGKYRNWVFSLKLYGHYRVFLSFFARRISRLGPLEISFVSHQKHVPCSLQAFVFLCLDSNAVPSPVR